jgi:predicted Zn-dependent protease
MKKLLFIFFLSINIQLVSEDVLSESVYYELTRADTKIEEKKFDEAENILEKLYKRGWRSKSYNKAVIARTYGFFLYQRERMPEALDKLQVAYDEKALPLQESTTLVQVLAQLYATEKKVEKAKTLLLDFIKTAEKQPKPVPGIHNIYGLTALVYATEKQYDIAYNFIIKAINLSGGFREDWYQLKFAIEYQNKDYLNAEKSAKVLLENKPSKKQYYVQMSAIYNINEKYDLALGTMEVSYMKGLLSKPEEFSNLASFYLYKQNPASSARVLERALDKDQISLDKTFSKLLADSWLFAKEREKSLDVVDEALKINEEDEALINQYITIAFSAFQWDEVIKGIERAKSKNINKDGKYDLMLGIAYFELDDVINAEAAFNNAKISEKYKDQGAAWLEYLQALKG